MFLVAGVLPCAPPGNGAWGTPRTSWLQRRSKIRVDGRVVVFSAVPQASASPFLTSLYGKGYEASSFFCNRLFGLVCLFTVGWFLYSTGLSGRNLFENTFLGLLRGFYMYIREGRIYTVPGLEKLLDKKKWHSKRDLTVKTELRT